MNYFKYKIIPNSYKRWRRIAFFISIISIIAALLFIILYFWNFKGEISKNHQYWYEFAGSLSAFSTLVGLAGIIYTFIQIEHSTRKSNSLPICLELFKELRSMNFLRNKSYIESELIKYHKQNKITSINDNKDKKLKTSIMEHLRIMNNISAIIVHDLADDELVISYYGINMLQTFKLLQPFLEQQRVEMSKPFTDNLNEHSYLKSDDRKLISDARKLEYAHYELLIKNIQKKGNEIIDKIDRELKK